MSDEMNSESLAAELEETLAEAASDGDCSCEEVAKHLFELLDSQMCVEQTARLRRHTENCEHCSQMADAEVHVREIIKRSCCGQAAPESLRMKIYRQIEVYRIATT